MGEIRRKTRRPEVDVTEQQSPSIKGISEYPELKIKN
jgi:hypothetical protein